MNKSTRTALSFFMKDAYPLFNPSSSGVFGGAEVDLYFIARELAKKEKYSVKFFVGDYGQPRIEERDRVTLVKLRYSDLNQYGRWYHKIIRRIYIIGELFLDSSDILITKTASDTLGYLVLINKLLKRKKVIFKLGSDIDADIGFWKGKNLLIYFLYKFSLKFVDCIICQSGTQQKLLASHLNKKPLVIKNGFPLENNQQTDRKSQILWVSRYDYMKRPEMFIRLAQALPEERFVMVMPGKEKAKGSLSSETAGTENLTLIDSIPFHEMQDYFNRAKCFVNTSEFEGFPNTFIQACLGATPILSFNVNPDNFIDKYSLGCFCNNSLDTAINFIKSLNENRILFYGKNALKYVEQEHNIVDKLEEYERLIDTL